MAESVTRNFHLPLPDEIYQSIRSEAQRQRRPATMVVREVLEQWLARQRAEAIHLDISNYAAKHAGTRVDLDPSLEAAGIETLVRRPAKPRRRRGHERDRQSSRS